MRYFTRPRGPTAPQIVVPRDDGYSLKTLEANWWEERYHQVTNRVDFHNTHTQRLAEAEARSFEPDVATYTPTTSPKETTPGQERPVNGLIDTVPRRTRLPPLDTTRVIPNDGFDVKVTHNQTTFADPNVARPSVQFGSYEFGAPFAPHVKKRENARMITAENYGQRLAERPDLSSQKGFGGILPHYPDDHDTRYHETTTGYFAETGLTGIPGAAFPNAGPQSAPPVYGRDIGVGSTNYTVLPESTADGFQSATALDPTKREHFRRYPKKGDNQHRVTASLGSGTLGDEHMVARPKEPLITRRHNELYKLSGVRIFSDFQPSSVAA